jgi:23S rRNA (guanine2445-N2)-methyltransferase / 23S rRNA (guanine2069-N7)-methyltransferase
MGAQSRKGHKEFFATAPRGLEELLVSDLAAAGIGSARASAGGAIFSGSLEEAYRACLWSRVAGRVLLMVADIPARDEAELHAGVMDIPWEEHFPADTTLAVDFIGTSDSLRHTLFGARRVKDGVVDRLRAVHGSRPSVDLEAPGLRLVARLHRDRLGLGIDISGPAHRRGYRTSAGAAPLRENLAAAVLLRAGWPTLCAGGAALFDPLCGSGTFLIEAALMAAGAAPGERRACGSPAWAGHDPALLGRLREAARSARLAGTPGLPLLAGADRDARVIEIARGNADRAGFAEQLQFDVADITDEGRPPGLRDCQGGLLVCNPPYGERLGAASEAALVKLYTRLGDLAREEFADWRVAILAPDAPLAAHLGLRGARRYRFRNGPIECSLLVRDAAGQGRAARRE